MVREMSKDNQQNTKTFDYIVCEITGVHIDYYDRCAVRPLSLNDRFAERLIQHLRLYQSDSERSERSFVFQRKSAV